LNNAQKPYFLPYQRAWLEDKSPVKIWEKSRRIGATYVQAYEDVRDAATGKVPAVWFSSADESAAREYILYCAHWARVLHYAAKDMGLVVLDDEKDIKTFTIEFANGTRINALSSNPKAFRSKGGKAVLDELSFHEKASELWKAAKPITTWGFPLRILSTHNGMSSLFYQFTERVKQGKLAWNLHKTTIYDAVDQGLYDKILGRKATKKERSEWIKQLEDDCFDHDTFLQEYCCQPVDEATAFLAYELIGSCENPNILMPLDQVQGDLYVGMDIGRKKDLSVIFVLEKLGNVKYSRMIKIMERAQFSYQREALFSILSHPNLRRACIDATGLGMQLAEEAQNMFGKYRVEAITFTAKAKEEMAYLARTSFEDRTIAIPSEMALREDLHSVRKISTTSGNVRFDVLSAERLDSHADRFWALALAIYAAHNEGGPIYLTGRKRRASADIFQESSVNLKGF